MLYSLHEKHPCEAEKISHEPDIAGGTVLCIRQMRADLVTVARIGGEPVISSYSVVNSFTCKCQWCGAIMAPYVTRFRNNPRRIFSCKGCADFSTLVCFRDNIYNINTHRVDYIGGSIKLPIDGINAPIMSCPGETQGVRILILRENEYYLHLISDRSNAIYVPSWRRRLQDPFMRDDNTLCAWYNRELSIWDMRMSNAQTHTVDAYNTSPRASSAFATDNIFMSLLSVTRYSVLCGTYDLRNVSDAITMVPTHAHAVV